MTSPSIKCLLASRSPTAILWLVSLIVINPLYSQSFGRIAHIQKEVFKSKPASADHNTSTSVVRKIHPFRVGASLNHVRPDPVNFSVGATHGLTMDFPIQRQVGRLLAPAGLGIASFEGAGVDQDRFATSTDTLEYSCDGTACVTLRCTFFNYLKASKDCANRAGFLRHNIGRFNVLFSGGRPAVTGARCDYE